MNRLNSRFAAKLPTIENRSSPVPGIGIIGLKGGVFSMTMRTGKLLSEVNNSPAPEES
jgi:hypothetical protein